MRKKWLIIISIVVTIAVSLPMALASMLWLGANKNVETDSLQKLGYTLKDSQAIPQGQSVWADNYSQFLQYVETYKPSTVYDIQAKIDWLAPIDGHGSFSWKIPPDIPQDMREALYFIEDGTVYVYQ